ncbi:MAG TPA: hypothetical protein ENF55_03675 [Thermoprotei archaeon]|nr:hypothetical protein [Thermoprotei archaeon]
MQIHYITSLLHFLRALIGSLTLMIGVGVAVATVLSLIILLRSPVEGVTITTTERLFFRIGGKKKEFLDHLKQEIARRNLNFIKASRSELDLEYSDTFNKAYIYTDIVGDHLRYGFRIYMRRPVAIAIIFLTAIGLVVPGVILFLYWLVKYNSLKEALLSAGENAYILIRGE